MKVIQYSAYGHPPDMVEIADLDPGSLAENEVLIEVEATPVTLNDIYCISGKAGFRHPLPAVPGGRGIGRIVEAGSAVTGVTVGQRVFLPRPGGTWREYQRASADGLFAAPEGGDTLQLALVNSNVMTAYALLKCVHDLDPGEWIIQNGANSSCGHYIIQLAKLWGLKTVNVVRRASAVEGLKALGADVVLVDGTKLAKQAAAATGEAKIRLGFDMVAGDATGQLAACLTRWGTVACYGAASGKPYQVPGHIMRRTHIRLLGFGTDYRLDSRRTSQEISQAYADMSRLVGNGTLFSNIAGVYSFAEVAGALAHAAKSGDERSGKIILVPRRASIL
jgi:NADPH:quinone reductase-like Zn-dependent oxidoreductase